MSYLTLQKIMPPVYSSLLTALAQAGLPEPVADGYDVALRPQHLLWPALDWWVSYRDNGWHLQGPGLSYETLTPEGLLTRLRERLPQAPAYLYLFIRRDLPAPQRIVQSIHGAIEAVRTKLLPTSPHPHVTLLEVANEAELLATVARLQPQIPLVVFREPDQGNAATCAAAPIISGRDRLIFKPYALFSETL